MSKRLMAWFSVLTLTALGGPLLLGAIVPAQAQQACAKSGDHRPSVLSAGRLGRAGHRSSAPRPTLVSGIAARLGVKDVVSKDFGSWEGAQAGGAQAARPT